MLTSDETWGCAPDRQIISNHAKSAIERLLPNFSGISPDIEIVVEDLVDEETLEKLFIENPYEVLGVNSGMLDSLELNRVRVKPKFWFYRLPLLRRWIEAGDVVLETLLANAVLQEIQSYYRMDRLVCEKALLRAGYSVVNID